MTGTVFDIGYQHYDGTREGRARGRAAVFKDGVRIALGFGRGPRAKVIPFLFIGILSLIALIMAMVAGAANRMGGAGAADEAGIPSHGDYYGIAASFLFAFAAIVAPELLCRDKREGTINLYLVRPLTGSDYVLGRWAAFLVVVTITAWLPQCVLFLGRCMGDVAPVTYFRAHWLDIPRFLAGGLAMSLYATSLAMLVASFTTRRAFAAVFLVGVTAITSPFTMGLASELDGAAGQWVSMFNLVGIPVHVNDLLFGAVSEYNEDAPARTLPAGVRVAWWAAWTLVPFLVLWNRYRRLSA